MFSSEEFRKEQSAIFGERAVNFGGSSSGQILTEEISGVAADPKLQSLGAVRNLEVEHVAAEVTDPNS